MKRGLCIYVFALLMPALFYSCSDAKEKSGRKKVAVVVSSLNNGLVLFNVSPFGRQVQKGLSSSLQSSST